MKVDKVIIASLIAIGIIVGITGAACYCILPEDVAGEHQPVLSTGSELIGTTYPVVWVRDHYIHLIDTTGEFAGFVHPVQLTGHYTEGQVYSIMRPAAYASFVITKGAYITELQVGNDGQKYYPTADGAWGKTQTGYASGPDGSLVKTSVLM